MGFFSGLAQGFQSGRKQKLEEQKQKALEEYRRNEQARQAARDAQQDKRYYEEREMELERQAKLDERYQSELEYARGRDATADERWQATFDQGQQRWDSEFGLRKSDSDRAASQWDATFNYRRDRDSVSDEQWSAQQVTAAAAAEESRRRFEKQFEFTAQESEKAAERWNTKFGFDKERAVKADEWQQVMQDYRATRDTISDEQWNSTFDYNQDQAKMAEERWNIEHGFRKDQALTAENRWQAEMDWREERAKVADEQFETQLSDKRMTTLISAGLTPGGSGGSSSGTTNKTTAGKIADSVIALQSRVEAAELDNDDKAYFKAILKDPAAAHKIYSFMQTQAADGNVIELNDIPSLIQIAGVSEGKSEEAMALLKSSNIDLKDQDAFFGALQTLKDYSPARVVTDIQPEAYRNPGDIKVIKDQRDLFVDTSIPAAQALLGTLGADDPARHELSRALANVSSSDPVIKSRAVTSIMKHVVTPEHVERLEARGGAFKNLSQNEFLMPYMPEVSPEEVQAEVETTASGMADTPEPIPSVSQADSTPVDTGTVIDDIPSFDSFQAVEAWRAEGNSGAVSVGGRTFSVDPIEQPAAAEPAAAPVETGTALTDEPMSEAESLANLAKEEGIRSAAGLNKFIFKNVPPIKGDRKATQQLQRSMFDEISAILGL